MDAKQLIKDKILETAKQSADELVSNASAECARSKETLSLELAAKSENSAAKARLKAEQILAQAEIEAGLEHRKAILAVKRALVDKVFDDALQKLISLDDKQYSQLIFELVCRYAEKGDTVIINQSDEKRLNDKWLDTVCNSCGFKLTFAQETHNEKGGVILRSKGFDKKLTLGALIAKARDKNENTVIERLFG